VNEIEEPGEWIDVGEPNEDEGEYFYQNDFIDKVKFEEELAKEEEKIDEDLG
jgi:hypothetical protein